ncbi:MAG: hypothetical protein M0R06_25085 [Sphaerochaeta sp.]|nr:hypothetical protein [Sphaerochaeta sp.]
MSKVVGELKSKVRGTGCVDVTVEGTKVRCWETIKGRDGVVRANPVLAQLEGCRVGDIVEAEIVERQSNGRTFMNLGGISLQTKPEAVQSSAPVYPVGQSDHTWETFQMTHGPAVIKGLIAGLSGKDVDLEGNPTGKVRDFSWLEEGNGDRVVAMWGALMDSMWLNFDGRRACLENAVD